MNKILKVRDALAFHLNPERIKREFRKKVRTAKFIKKGFVTMDPNYLFFPDFKAGDIAIDVGCGFEVELASYLIDNYNMKCFCVDPTMKHNKQILEKVVKYNGKLTYFQNALCSQNCTLTFNETLDNESGSIFNDHVNILHDRISSYTVEGIDLDTLLGRADVQEIAFLKIDIEGAEYDLFKNVNKDSLRRCRQLFVEFHHVSVERFTKKDTLEIVKLICNFGFTSYSTDNLNYLFIRV